jgi:hypothetical protein
VTQTHDEIQETAAAGPTRLRAPWVREQQTFSTALALLHEGIRPTNDRVRMRTGGSPNTIAAHMERFWPWLGTLIKGSEGRALPQLPQRIEAAVLHLWNEALSAAQEAAQATQQHSEAALRERAQALESQALELAPLKESLQLMQEQLGAANRRAETLEARLVRRDQELEQARGRIDALQQDLRESHALLEQERKAHEKARAQLESRHEAAEKRWHSEVERARQHLKATEKQRDESRMKGDKQAAEITMLRERLARVEAAKPQRKAPRRIARKKTSRKGS